MSNLTLEQAIENALAHEGEQSLATQAYMQFLKSQLLLPIEHPDNHDDDEPRVLFLETDNQVFLPVFSQLSFIKDWAKEDFEKIGTFQLSGIELLKGLGENVTVALNPGTTSYKEFNPEEIDKLKTMVMKIQSLMQK